ncbi:START domain-containing protein 10-like [Tubulanus polymorphus]|uniref:START domain-containing protein 10-like n=1 Tax=Tubulanus polymorphus TaxID=672921 RepID=UPI003DA6104F
MEVGKVKIAEDSDFAYFKNSCVKHDDWKEEYKKSSTKVWTRKTENSHMKQIKVLATFPDISLDVLYDVVHDPDYRAVWDKHMISGREICYINANNDIGYYAVRAPTPLKNRDFVTQRSWLYTEREEFIIMNHSVNHVAAPATKEFIRGISYLTGYYVVADGAGTKMYYITQCDLKGKLPHRIVDKGSTIVAPKVTNRLHKAARDYKAWKAVNRPHWKPWLNPDQLNPELFVSIIKLMKDGDIQSLDLSSDNSIDESNISEKDCDVEGMEAAMVEK